MKLKKAPMEIGTVIRILKNLKQLINMNLKRKYTKMLKCDFGTTAY